VFDRLSGCDDGEPKRTGFCTDQHGSDSAEYHLTRHRLPQHLSAGQHFAGRIVGFTVERTVLSPAQVQQLATTPPDPSLIDFDEGSKGWPL
jgi:hypothetical protein